MVNSTGVIQGGVFFVLSTLINVMGVEHGVSDKALDAANNAEDQIQRMGAKSS